MDANRSAALLRQRRWMVVPKCLAILAGSFLLADTADAVIAAAVGTERAAIQRARSVPSGEGRTRTLEEYLVPIVRRNVFLHGEPVPGEETTAPAVEEEGGEGCTLPVQVLASVFVPREPELSLATLLDSTNKRIFVVQVGERVLDQAVLVEVREPFDEVAQVKESVAVFRRDDGRVTVCRSDDAQPAPTTLARGGARPNVPTGEGIKRVADDRYEIPQAEIDAVMNGGLATIATTVRIVPYFEGGKASGFKLYSIKSGSLLSKIGLVSGDVLRKVNGYEISSPEKALEVYGILKNERNVTLDITRAGKPRTFQYSIR